MPAPNYIALAIPLFFLLIGVELVLARRQGLKLYRFNDSLAALSCGISQQVVGIFLKVLRVAGYVWVYENHSLMKLDGQAWGTWVFAFFGVDLAYYLWHRASHRVAIIWATHVVHHQSQEYNLSVALRQAWFSSSALYFFYVPLAIAGVPPVLFVAVESFSTLYQFWIHTRTVKDCGWLIELVFNTPAHHRVHHAINPRYLDRNYGATLIIWDRLFGTFEKETEEEVYGTVEPFESWNPIWANFEYPVKLTKTALAMPGFANKLLTFLMPPGWVPGHGQLAAPEVDASVFVKWDTPRVPPVTRRYIFAQFVLTLLLATALLFVEAKLPEPAKVGAVLFILAGLLTWSGFFEHRRWAWPLEVARLTAGSAALVAFAFLA